MRWSRDTRTALTGTVTAWTPPVVGPGTTGTTGSGSGAGPPAGALMATVPSIAVN